jgi:hypothetical protein
MPILSSILSADSPQQDGRFWVHESHLGSDGETYTVDYLADPSLDINQVLTLRAQSIGAQIDARAAAEAEAANFEMPITKYAFRQRFTDAERYAIDAFNDSFESNQALTDQQKAGIRSYLKDFDAATQVHLSKAAPALQLYVALGLLTADRATAIGTL